MDRYGLEIINRLLDRRILLITGPRQVGKTTLIFEQYLLPFS